VGIMSKFSEKVFNKIDNAKIYELKEVSFKTECLGDVTDILTELVKYGGNDKQLRDFDGENFTVSEVIYNYGKKRTYLKFEDEEDIK
jgi:hypothetical protein